MFLASLVGLFDAGYQCTQQAADVHGQVPEGIVLVMVAELAGEDDVIFQLAEGALGDVVEVDFIFAGSLLEALGDIGGVDTDALRIWLIRP
jgi:hypothetical protein